MRAAFLSSLFILGCVLTATAQDFYGTSNLKAFRDGRDKEFRDRESSPLTEAGFERFDGLNYFPTDRRFRVRATFTLTYDGRIFEMPTSSGSVKRFVKYATLSFRINGKPQKLSVFQSEAETLKKYPEYAHLLLVPFKDATNRTSTFGGGRYISIVEPKGKMVILDFNLAYNPSCAYGSDRFSCPVPPAENRLAVAITAGEKRYTTAEND